MANSRPQRAGPGLKGQARPRLGGGGWGGAGPPWPSLDINWPWSDLLTDVALTSVGGLGVKGRGEGVVWVGEPLWASDSVKRKETNHCSQGRGAPFGGLGGAQESRNS